MKNIDAVPSSSQIVPPDADLKAIARIAKNCTACDLYKRGTQTVFGEGKPGAKVMFIGQQPGNEEDLKGRPFVGPAGTLLNGALEEAGIDRQKVYVTNVVKHFKWEPRGKRRLHQKPNTTEIAACRPWLDHEIRLVKPQVIVCLGATAAQALLGSHFRVSTQRGKLMPSPLAAHIMATIHPSSILRTPDAEARREAREKFVRDLEKIRDLV
jgi:uracil-DNA glycosylase family protein